MEAFSSPDSLVSSFHLEFFLGFSFYLQIDDSNRILVSGQFGGRLRMWHSGKMSKLNMSKDLWLSLNPHLGDMD